MIRISTLLFSVAAMVMDAAAQNNLTYNIDLSPGRKVSFEVGGGNTERMFYRMKHPDHPVPQVVIDDLFNKGDQVFRFPGGMTSNHYRFQGGAVKGYGLSRQEIEHFNHPMSCNLPKDGTDNCMTFDVEAERNYIYDFLDICDQYMQLTGKKKRVVWIPNFLSFFVHDIDNIHLLDKAGSLSELAAMVANGEISQGFYNRAKDNIDVFQILYNHPSIDVVGIEYGNELYFHSHVAILPHDPTNALPRWLFEATKDRLYADMAPGISRWRSIIDFYNKAINPKSLGVKTGIPVGIIAHTGVMPPFNALYNQHVKDSLISKVDAIIHHWYFRIDAPRIEPTSADSNPAELDQIKTVSDEFIHNRIPRIDGHYDNFFNLSATGKKMWITEFNLKNGPLDGIQALWMNTFYHSYFLFEAYLSFIDNYHNNDMVEFAFKHLWAGRWDDYNYAGYSVEALPDGSARKIKRATYSTFEILGSLAGKNLRKLNFDCSNSAGLQGKDFRTWTYYEPENDKSGHLYILFSNKSGIPARVDFKNDVRLTGGIASADSMQIGSISARFSIADNIYTSNGRTYLLPNTPDEEKIIVNNVQDIDPNGIFEIPGYSIGYLAIPLGEQRVETSVNTAELSQLVIYPNPVSNGLITVGLGNDFSLQSIAGVYRITDMLGREIKASVKMQQDGFIQLDVRNFPAGMYNISYQGEKQMGVGQFIVQ
jgi:hypothetical protein